LEAQREEIQRELYQSMERLIVLRRDGNDENLLRTPLTGIADLRTRVEQIEQQTIDEFNNHMGTILDILRYAHIERIWAEQTEHKIHEDRQKVAKSRFDVHIVRSTDDGVTHGDEFTHLSESEPEVTGLVFALAGYLVQEVYEDVLLTSLDSLEAIDPDQIAERVDYFHEYTDYLVVALPPGDTRVLDDDHEGV
jgi:hypothetical protein